MPDVQLPGALIPAARLFASARSAPAARRLADLVELVGMVAGLFALGWWAIPTRSFDASLAAFLASAPGWISSLWKAVYCLALLPPLVVVASAIVRRRWRVVLQALVAAAVAIAMAAAVGRTYGTTVDVSGWAFGTGTAVWPAAVLGVLGAASVATWPELVTPARRLAIRALLVAGVAAALAATASPTSVVAGLLVAASAGAAARLALGTSAGHLEVDEVERLVAALGVQLQTVGLIERRRDGELVIQAVMAPDLPVSVKVHARDAVESRFAHRLYRAALYRDGAGTLALPRAPGLSDETLATLLAAGRGARVWEVEAAGRPDRAAEMMVLRTPGYRLSERPTTTANPVAAMWDTLGGLHAAGFAHLGLAPRAFVELPEGQLALTDLRDAVAVPDDDQIATDEAQLLVTLATLVGCEAAVAGSVALIGGERIERLAPYLQPAALGGELRRAVREAKVDVDALRAAAIAEAGIEQPELAQLRRVTIGGLVRAALLVLAASAILSLVTGLDMAALRESLGQATVPLAVLAFLTAQLPRLGQAVSTLGSVPARLPFGPVYGMQLATSFMNLALPSAAARMALSVRFFQRQGVPPATAVTSGLIDSLVGNVIQAVLLALFLLFSPAAFDAIPAGGAGTGSASHPLIAALAIAAVVTLVVVVAVGRIRRRIVDRVRAWWPDVRASLQPLRTRRKLGQLIGGNLAAELLFAMALAMMAHAFGADITIVDALLVNVSSSLVAMVVPVPGGIGVAEATLIVGLGAVGVDETTAFGITIAYRLSTFYLPPIWGWFAMHWLEKRRYL